jgi:hypothetical protein
VSQFVALFGSGETARNGRRVHQRILEGLPYRPAIAILETPAGFEPNVADVSRKFRDFFETKLGQFKPDVMTVPARMDGGVFDVNSSLVDTPIGRAHLVAAGPGSPTYAARVLAGSRTLKGVEAALERGASISLASAAAMAFGRHVIPVYEIYKAGHELSWNRGLDLFSRWGRSLTVIPHWDNSDGGQGLDTSRCYVGQRRFEALRRMIPRDTPILGIDEHTCCLINLTENTCEIIGSGSVTLLDESGTEQIPNGIRFELSRLTRCGDAGQNYPGLEIDRFAGGIEPLSGPIQL